MSLLQKLAGLAGGIEHGIANAVHPQQQYQNVQDPQPLPPHIQQALQQLPQLQQLMIPRAQMHNAQGQPQWRPGDGGAPRMPEDSQNVFAVQGAQPGMMPLNQVNPGSPWANMQPSPYPQNSIGAINTDMHGGLGGSSNGQYVPYNMTLPPYLQQRR